MALSLWTFTWLERANCFWFDNFFSSRNKSFLHSHRQRLFSLKKKSDLIFFSIRTWNGLQTVDQFIDWNSRVFKVYKQFYFRFSEISIYRLIVSLELILEKKRKQLERLNERFVEVRANIQYLHVENMHETCECTMVIAVVLLLLLCSLMHAMVFDNNNNNIMWCARPFYRRRGNVPIYIKWKNSFR